MRIIGVTGGIACGKSTVSDYLSSHYQLPIQDADSLARELVAPGSLLLPQLRDRFGAAIFLPDGCLDRATLGTLVFQDLASRRWLEGLIHPLVRDRLQQVRDDFLQAPPQPTTVPIIPQGPGLVFVIPLLFEAGMEDLVSECWVISCDPNQQLDRLMTRNHLTYFQAMDRIQSQWPLAAKAARADRVLDNRGTVEQLYQQIDWAIAHPPSDVSLRRQRFPTG
jgi:dephospho-CoA kinase